MNGFLQVCSKCLSTNVMVRGWAEANPRTDEPKDIFNFLSGSKYAAEYAGGKPDEPISYCRSCGHNEYIEVYSGQLKFIRQVQQLAHVPDWAMAMTGHKVKIPTYADSLERNPHPSEAFEALHHRCVALFASVDLTDVAGDLEALGKQVRELATRQYESGSWKEDQRDWNVYCATHFRRYEDGVHGYHCSKCGETYSHLDWGQYSKGDPMPGVDGAKCGCEQ